MSGNNNHDGFVHNLDKSALFTIIGIVLLFTASIVVILVAPTYVDPTWTSPTSSYQVQMYEVSDPNLYIGVSSTGSADLEFVYHIIQDFTLLAFHESDALRIVAPPHLENYVTRQGDPELKLTSKLLLLRQPVEGEFKAQTLADKVRSSARAEWEKQNPKWKEENIHPPSLDVLELYAPAGDQAFALAPSDGIIENWVDHHYKILDEAPKQNYHRDPGVIYINNPREYRYSKYTFADVIGWRYDPSGEAIQSLADLKKHPLGFTSRKDLIAMGEHQYSIEGCWYCHTDQTRTLVQDVVLNGSAEYPAPPSSANEYIYQQITFPGTRRIGPDLSRTGIKRPSRDWHKGHFWSPKTASKGSIMPAMRHFFDNDPRGVAKAGIGIPNRTFEAVYQYLMTKGTRITPPTEAWWLGKDPINIKAIIDGEKVLQ